MSDLPAELPERELRPIEWFKPDPHNARTHSEAQVRHIADLVVEFGWTFPILADENGGILAGHGRLRAARLLGMTEVPTRIAAGWSDEQKRLYKLADNKVATEAGWDDEILAIELGDLVALGVDVGLTGFDTDALTAILGPSEEAIAGAKVAKIDTSAVADVFWIQVGGPLAHQAEILQRLHALCGDFPSIEVRLGTTNRDG
ncbi:MAG: ParB/Srx family N-terminal domain-containing protein [Janthinobacterium lividum]